MMDKGCGGGGEELGDGMQCSNHPYKSSPGGICAMCLQEKLGKLVSSKSNSFFPVSSSSSASPSFRSAAGASSSLSLTRIPFHLKGQATTKEAVEDSRRDAVLNRSKSSAAPRHHLLDAPTQCKRRGFWSFIHRGSGRSRRRGRAGDAVARPSVHPTPTASSSGAAVAPAQQQTNINNKDKAGEPSSSKNYGDENESPNSSSSSSFGRKVARSRSVGCGSRSFSGDFLERLSTGFGDCTVLRRVESQREAKPTKPQARAQAQDHHRIKERVKCGGLFGGFGMTTLTSTTPTAAASHPHGRTKSWGWSLASPMRALMSKDTSAATASDAAVLNLVAIPSLLTVRS